MEKQAIDFTKIKKLIVKTVDTDVKIFGTQSSDTYVTYESQQPHLEYKDDTLTISTRDKHFSLLGPVIFGSGSSQESMEIAVPYELKELMISGVSSDITIRSV
ncbi:MAG TPA: DUF4097 family beta strand repeat-containing protein, partial [Pseudothermotoga sp.]